MKKFTLAKQNNIWRKTNGICAHCGKVVQKRERTVDHYIPRVKGGTYDSRNLMPLCKSCNRSRGSQPIDPFQFYSFAPGWANAGCLEYKKEFFDSCKNALGEIIR